MPALGCALEDAGHLGQQVGPASGEFAEFGHRGGLLVRGEIAPAGVVPGGSGELGDEKPVSSRRETILIHLFRIERASGYLKQAGKLSRQSRSWVAVGSDIPGQLLECHPQWASSRARCPGVLKDLKKVLAGEKLSPILLAEGDIADGYHRVSLAYALDLYAEVPLKLAAAASS